MADYSKITNDDFQDTLSDLLHTMRGNELLDIPGVYEILSEHFNNTVLEIWAQNNPELAYPEDYEDDEEDEA